jgi:hypothetical protein
MSGKRLNDLGWHDNRFTILLSFIVILSGCFYLLSLLFSPEGPDIRTYTNDEGCEVSEYFYPYSQNPFMIVFNDRDGNLSEKWFDRNTNGHFESKSFYVNDSIASMSVSLADDGVVDLKRIFDGLDQVEKYDRNRDGFWEETHFLRDGNRVKEIIDRNNDGNPEQQIIYDLKGDAIQLILDFNSDGKPDVVLPRNPQDVGNNKSAQEVH